MSSRKAGITTLWEQCVAFLHINCLYLEHFTFKTLEIDIYEQTLDNIVVANPSIYGSQWAGLHRSIVFVIISSYSNSIAIHLHCISYTVYIIVFIMTEVLTTECRIHSYWHSVAIVVATPIIQVTDKAVIRDNS